MLETSGQREVPRAPEEEKKCMKTERKRRRQLSPRKPVRILKTGQIRGSEKSAGPGGKGGPKV